MVRGWEGQKATGVRLVAGTRVVLDDGRSLLLYMPAGGAVLVEMR